MIRNCIIILLSTLFWTESQAQKDFSHFEYDWCKPHASYRTQFAISNFEAAFIPVSYNNSLEVTGYKTFYHLALTKAIDSTITPEQLFSYYQLCFDKSIDTIFFQGPTLFCARLYKNQSSMYVSIQYANDGKNYYLTVIEAEKHPQNITADQIAQQLNKNKGSITIWLSGSRNDTTLRDPDVKLLREIVKSVRTHPNLNINIEVHTDAEGDKNELVVESHKKAQFIYKKLVAMGMDRMRAGYSGYGPSFPFADNSTNNGKILNNRIVITRKT